MEQSKNAATCCTPFSRKAPNSWAFSSHALFVRRGIHEGPPQAWEYAFHYPKARSRELKLRLLENQKDRVFRNLQLEDTNHQGLLFAYKGSMDGDEFDTEFFLENALEILEEEAES